MGAYCPASSPVGTGDGTALGDTASAGADVGMSAPGPRPSPPRRLLLLLTACSCPVRFGARPATFGDLASRLKVPDGTSGPRVIGDHRLPEARCLRHPHVAGDQRREHQRAEV